MNAIKKVNNVEVKNEYKDIIFSTSFNNDFIEKIINKYPELKNEKLNTLKYNFIIKNDLIYFDYNKKMQNN